MSFEDLTASFSLDNDLRLSLLFLSWVMAILLVWSLFSLKLFVVVLLTLYLETFRGGCGGWLFLISAEFSLFGRLLFTSEIFSLEEFLLISCDLFWAPGTIVGGLDWTAGDFLSNERYLNFYKEEFIFFSGIIYKGFSFFFMFICWLTGMFWFEKLVGDFFPLGYFCWISLLIYLSNSKPLVFDFLLVEQLENKSSASSASPCAQFNILPSFLFFNSLKISPSFRFLLFGYCFTLFLFGFCLAKGLLIGSSTFFV